MDDNLWFPGMELSNEHINTTVKDAFKINCGANDTMLMLQVSNEYVQELFSKR